MPTANFLCANMFGFLVLRTASDLDRGRNWNEREKIVISCLNAFLFKLYRSQIKLILDCHLIFFFKLARHLEEYLVDFKIRLVMPPFS